MYNFRGVRINGLDAKKAASYPLIHPLSDGDLLVIFQHHLRFRFYSNRKEDEREVGVPSLVNGSLPRGGVRLNPAKTTKNLNLRDVNVVGEENDCRDLMDTTRDRSKCSSSERCTTNNLPTHESTSIRQRQIPITGSQGLTGRRRRSLTTLTTPKKAISQVRVPWSADPVKQRREPHRAHHLSILESSCSTKVHKGTIVKEEIQYDQGKAIHNDETWEKENCRPHEVTQSNSYNEEEQELTGSVSTARAKPLVAKPRRRSSFFGRAGLFANWNFGFYPDERIDNENLQRHPFSTTASPVTTISNHVIPEPRLDENGRPRLPRSLSSPGGLGAGSPKRRIVSLRTATLLKAGQSAFDKQKHQSPSPQKGSKNTSHSMLECGSSQDDDDEADEVERSLSVSCEDGAQEHDLHIRPLSQCNEEIDVSPKAQCEEGENAQAFAQREKEAYSATRGATADDLLTNTKRGKPDPYGGSSGGRSSLPSRPFNLDADEATKRGDFKQLMPQWQAQGIARIDEKRASVEDVDRSNQFADTDLIVEECKESLDQQTIGPLENPGRIAGTPESSHHILSKRLEQGEYNFNESPANTMKDLPPASPESPFRMLRYMVRSSPQLTEVVNQVEDRLFASSFAKHTTEMQRVDTPDISDLLLGDEIPPSNQKLAASASNNNMEEGTVDKRVEENRDGAQSSISDYCIRSATKQILSTEQAHVQKRPFRRMSEQATGKSSWVLSRAVSALKRRTTIATSRSTSPPKKAHEQDVFCTDPIVGKNEIAKRLDDTSLKEHHGTQDKLEKQDLSENTSRSSLPANKIEVVEEISTQSGTGDTAVLQDSPSEATCLPTLTKCQSEDNVSEEQENNESLPSPSPSPSKGMFSTSPQGMQEEESINSRSNVSHSKATSKPPSDAEPCSVVQTLSQENDNVDAAQLLLAQHAQDACEIVGDNHHSDVAQDTEEELHRSSIVRASPSPKKPPVVSTLPVRVRRPRAAKAVAAAAISASSSSPRKNGASKQAKRNRPSLSPEFKEDEETRSPKTNLAASTQPAHRKCVTAKSQPVETDRPSSRKARSSPSIALESGITETKSDNRRKRGGRAKRAVPVPVDDTNVRTTRSRSARTQMLEKTVR